MLVVAPTAVTAHLRTISVVFVACLLLEGCGLLPSAYRMDLYQTRWAATSLDGEPMAGATLSFNEDAVDGVVTVRTPCGTTHLGVDLDSDGDGIGFENLEPRPSICSSDEQSADDAFFDVLEDVEGWRVVDYNHITLIGTGEIALARS